MRFDEQREVYRDCQWCQGRGCLYCKAEAEKAYKAEFPDGPKPIATFDLTTPEGVEAAKSVIGVDALSRAFGPDGGGMTELMENIAKAKAEGGAA